MEFEIFAPFAPLRANFCGMIGGDVDHFMARFLSEVDEDSGESDNPLLSLGGVFVEDRLSSGMFGVGFDELRRLLWAQIFDYERLDVLCAPSPHIYHRGYWSYGIYLRILYEIGDLDEEEYTPLAVMWLHWLTTIEVPHIIVYFGGSYDVFGADFSEYVRGIYEDYLEGYALSGTNILRLPQYQGLGLSRDAWYRMCLSLIHRALSAHLPN